jgi:hypothetical protein
VVERKVLNFNHRVSINAQNDARDPALFASADIGRGKIVFVKIDNFVEETFLKLIALNAVTAIIDLRPRPVFGRPHFHHKRTVSYLFQRKIAYIEYALSRNARQISNVSSHEDEVLKSALESALIRGLTVCVYDETSREVGWLDQFRKTLRSISGYNAEMNPRSLI